MRDTSTLSDLILNELEKAGQNVRKAYQRRLPSDTSKDYYFLHRDTGITEPIIIEYGFLDSTSDDVGQLKNEYIRYADAVARAIADYINVPYTMENTYIVKSGDSLWNIAKKFDTTVETLKQLNNLSSNLLSIGQVLEVPLMEEINPIEEYKIYTVKDGDNLYNIARLNNTTVTNLIDYNNLSNTILKPGQTILIPLIKMEEDLSDYITYTVKSGDSLYLIANKYNTTVDNIKKFNNLNTNLLSIGQVLKIPVKEIQGEINTSSYKEYTVIPGDTLYSIANKSGISIDELKEFNDLTSNLLNVGQLLKIPISNLNTIYIVKSGDTLYSIANLYNTTIEKIKNDNNLVNNNLNIGQKIII